MTLKAGGCTSDKPGHCWHLLGTKGDEVCCWCGDIYVKDKRQPKPGHGRHSPDQVPVAKRTDACPKRPKEDA